MGKVLIVEDDQFFGGLLIELLADVGLDSKIVGSAQAALRHELDDVQAVLIDVMLPNNPNESGITVEETRGGYLSGVAVARRLRRQVPNLQLILFSSGLVGMEAREWALDNDVPFVIKSEGQAPFLQALRKLGLYSEPGPQAFIVHGHDERRLLELKNYLQNTLQWPTPIVLREEPSCGKTVIEKFEKYSRRVDFVFVILTPDDLVVGPDSSDDEKRRARQNVIFEMGFFYGQLGRDSGSVIVLYDGPVELPSDIQGIIWVDVSSGIEAAGEKIRREIVS